MSTPIDEIRKYLNRAIDHASLNTTCNEAYMYGSQLTAINELIASEKALRVRAEKAELELAGANAMIEKLKREVAEMESAWQVATLRRKDALIAKQEANNDQIKAELAQALNALEMAVEMIEQLEQAAPFKSIPNGYRLDGIDILRDLLAAARKEAAK